MNKLFTIIVAAGSGQRMSRELPEQPPEQLPKQFLLLGNEPIVMRTARNLEQAVRGCTAVDNVVHEMLIVLPQGYAEAWKEWCREYQFRLPHRVVTGGKSRAESVARAVAQIAAEAVDGTDHVLIHDGVRPFVTTELVGRLWTEALRSGAAIPVVPLVDSLRRVGGSPPSEPIDRAQYRAVQTPQLFRADLIKRAYSADPKDSCTDDAWLVEQVTRHPVALVPGDAGNIKITTPEDLLLARYRVEKEKK